MKEFKGVPYEVVRRPVRRVRLDFHRGYLRIVLPPGVDEEEVLRRNEAWILRTYREILKGLNKKLREERRTEEEFRREVLMLVAEAEEFYGVKANKVFFRKMRTRWGSCSSRGNITINRFARLLPRRLLEYLVYHEVAHLIERRHSRVFWRLLTKKFPDAKARDLELGDYWVVIFRESKANDM